MRPGDRRVFGFGRRLVGPTIVVGLLLQLCAVAWAGVPVALPVEEPDAASGRTIVVPDPLRGSGTHVAPTNLPALPAEPVVTNDNTGSRLKLMPAPELKTDSLRMREGGQEWSGTLVGWDGTTVTWNMPAAVCPTQVPCARVSTIALAPIGSAAVQPPRWIVKLTNGDLLTGNRLTMDTNQVTMALDGAGSLVMPLAQVASVQQDTAPAESRFHPLHRLDSWDRIVNQQVWTEASPEKRVVTNRWESGVYADLALPDQVAIEFAVPSKATANLNLRLVLFAASPAGLLSELYYTMQINQLGFLAAIPAGLLSAQTYTIQINGNSIGCWMNGGPHVAHLGARRESSIEGSCEWKPRPGRDWVDVGLRINRQTGRLLVTVDGEVRRVFALEALTDDCGRGMIVQCQPSGQELPRVMVLTPLGDDLAKGTAARTEDSVVLANGEGMTGTLESIGETNFVVVCERGNLSLPVNRLCAAQLARATRRELPARPGDAVIDLRGGGRLTGALSTLSPTGAVVEVEWAGKVALPRAAVVGARW